MASYKIVQNVGTVSLCDSIKDIRSAVAQVSHAVVQVSQAMQDLSAEVEDSINDLDARIDSLIAEIRAGAVSAPLATQNKNALATQGGVEIYAVRILENEEA